MRSRCNSGPWHHVKRGSPVRRDTKRVLFSSSPPKLAAVVQLVERFVANEKVAGSNPVRRSSNFGGANEKVVGANPITRSNLIGGRLTVGQWALDPSIQVRILAPKQRGNEKVDTLLFTCLCVRRMINSFYETEALDG